LAKKAIEEKFNRIIVVGGDGLLHEVINGVMEEKIPSDFVIGTIPTGSGNNFAKALGIKKNIKKSFEIIGKEKIISVDIGKVNERFFINCFSVGFDALVNKIANDLKERNRFLPRNLSYLLAALRQIIIKIPNFEVKIKGEEIDYKNKVVLVAITNSPSYGAIFKINPGAITNDGKFNVCIIEPVGKIRALLDLYRATKGTHIYLPEVKTLKFSLPLTISSPEPIAYETDGEVFEPKREYEIKIFPKAINFIVP
jgi:YegS/Rv2252/BmrU family lipid kinase